ncbi:peroxiredoxin-like family protein [Allomuricauda sp. SCSIO 65647]|uniref:peroxiredoxin-like family protein n=1 Tax=Allomuricauda sp. SCSIO 65647 TaxID=2908843 RepID=UPI001F3AE337|nr:peroxiredoxin-like family protein [Muricauda sp. SCSIO 65647]UJH66450.1 AhpC/TSA family protein [Muricauda sp. SCSIO 65647]
MTRPTPKHQAPELEFPLLGGSQWNLKNQRPQSFTLIVFYRGLHCPICKKYLQQLEGLRPRFEERGVQVVAVSMDSEKRARLSRKDWGLQDLPLGYGLDSETARHWGLYLSKAVKSGEPEIFSEPGLFLVDAAQNVYYASMTSNPWGRPYLPSFVKAVDYIVQSGYPARGEVL